MNSEHVHRHAMNHKKSGDAAAQQQRRGYKCRPEPACGIKPAVATKGDSDISWHFSGLPAGQSAPNLCHHGHFEQAAADGAHQTSCRKDISEQENRHKNLTAISPYVPTIRFNGQGYFYYPTNLVFEPRYRRRAMFENERDVPKVTFSPTTKVGYSGVRL